MSEDKLYADLRALGIDWSALEHQAVFTVEESLPIHDTMPGAHTKNLFLKDAAGQFWLVTVEHSARVDLKALAAALGAKTFRFGKAEAMQALLGVSPGSVTPLAAINAPPGDLRVVIDADLAGAARVHVHPLRNTATIGLSGPDLMRALAHWGHMAIASPIPRRI